MLEREIAEAKSIYASNFIYDIAALLSQEMAREIDLVILDQLRSSFLSKAENYIFDNFKAELIDGEARVNIQMRPRNSVTDIEMNFISSSDDLDD